MAETRITAEEFVVQNPEIAGDFGERLVINGRLKIASHALMDAIAITDKFNTEDRYTEIIRQLLDAKIVVDNIKEGLF